MARRKPAVAILLAAMTWLVLGSVAPAPGREAPMAERQPAPAPLILAGAARRDITPDTASWMAGYGAGPTRRSTGVHDRLYARALVLRLAGRDHVFVSLDLIGLFHEPIERIKEAVSEQLGSEPAYFVVASTHTHAGPDTLGLWGGVPSEYLDRVIAQAAGAVIEAAGRLRPATLAIGTVDVEGVSANRRVEGGPRTTEAGAVYVLEAGPGADGAPLATLISLGVTRRSCRDPTPSSAATWPGRWPRGSRPTWAARPWSSAAGSGIRTRPAAGTSNGWASWRRG